MKEILKYYYNIYVDNINEVKNGYFFFYKNYKYYFIKYDRNINEIPYLVNITNDLYNKEEMVNTFIINREGVYYSKVDEENYVLIKVNSPEDISYSLSDIISFNNLIISPSNIVDNWADLWSKKIDDIEEEVSSYNEDYPLIESTIDYYIGLCENAISYYIDTINEEDVSSVKININHKRIPYDVKSGFINNPVNLTMDYEVRDIAEYLKSSFFSSKINIDDIYYIRDLNLSVASYRLLYSRLLYPSYYIDLLIDIITGNKEEDVLGSVVNKYKEYNNFLNLVYEVLSEKYVLPKVEWISNFNY